MYLLNRVPIKDISKNTGSSYENVENLVWEMYAPEDANINLEYIINIKKKHDPKTIIRYFIGYAGRYKDIDLIIHLTLLEL